MTKSQIKFVAESYAKYFGRAPGADEIDYYGLKDNGKAEKASKVLNNIIADSNAEKGPMNTADFVDNAYQSLFGRDAFAGERSKYSKIFDNKGKLPITSIVKSAAKTDKAVYNNKMAVAVKYAELGGKDDLDLSKISKGNLIDIKFVNTVTTFADLKAKVEALADKSGIPSSFDGKTFVLTTSVDTPKGTNKDDLFIADNDNPVSGAVYATAADTLDGGKGTDTFKLYDTGASTAAALPTLKNIENVVLYNLAAGDFDAKKWDTVETLYVVSAKKGTSTDGFILGEKVTTVNFEDIAATEVQFVTFDNALTAATVGVNKVGTAATDTVTVDGTALKTLTINASGKESNFTLDQTATKTTIETLNITGEADLTLASGTNLTAVTTVDGSKAEGKLNLDLTASTAVKTVKTGSGNDTVTLANVTSGTTIDLGDGNDTLKATSVAASTITVIDGGAGIDTLDASLVNVGNGGVFVSFEILSLDAAINLDLDLLTKSTITDIYRDNGGVNTLTNVKKSQALTINTAATAATNATTLTFKDVAGTADAYTINFNADNATAAFEAGIVSVEGIETVIVNSVGKTGADNKITLKDADAKSLVITGDKDLTVAFSGTFGTAATATNGLGVSTIDASASTAGIKIVTGELAKVEAASSGLTIKGGAGDDNIVTGNITKAKVDTLTIDSGAGGDTIDLGAITVAVGGLTKADINVNAGAGVDIITVGAVGGTFTLGTGKDEITVTSATVGTATTVLDGTIKTTITDIEKGDIIKFGAASTSFAKAVIDGAKTLDEALDIAAKDSTGSVTTWFQYAGKTYIVDDNNAATKLNAADIVVELNGIVDLSNSKLNTTTGDLTIA